MNITQKIRGIGLCICLLMALSISGWSQNSNDARPVTSTYLIKNAFVVQKPGTVLPKTSILIEDGMIKSVGANVTIPFDAEIIDADSMYVYAAFIDACSHAGIPKPEAKDRPSVKNPGNPPKGLAGITPQHTVRDAMKEKVDKSMGDLRALGFGYVHVVPRGRMMPGQGSVVSTSGGSTDNTILLENVSQFSQFKSARGMFPATTIGVMSQFRDLLINAKHSNTYDAQYRMNPKGLDRPVNSNELKALYPVVDRKMPVFFYTPKIKDVNRALILQKELGYNMVFTGVRQGWPLMSSITSSRNPVVLSLKLPEELKEDKPDEDEKDKGDDKGDDKEKKEKKEEDDKDVDPELKMLKDKKMKSYKEYVGQAAMFEKKGVAFSFSSLDTKSKDIRSNLIRMVEHGLSQDAALAALTTNPAALLGMSNMAGTVEQGKIANLFITDKPYFEEESKIKFIINDGSVKENKEKKKKKSTGDGTVGELAGDWSYAVEIPGQAQSGVIRISGANDDLSIEVNSSDDPSDFAPASNVSLSDNELTFDLTIEGMTYNLAMEIDDESFEGTVAVGEFGTFPMSGEKKPN